MAETIYRASRSRPEVVPAQPRPAVDEPLGKRRRDAAPRGEGASVVDQTPERNGRLPRACSEEAWLLSWSAKLEQATDPRYLLANASRCYVGGKFNWSLYDLESGEVIWGGPSGRGPGCLEPSGGLVLQPDDEGTLRSYLQEQGSEEFWTSLFMSSDFRRPYVARIGDTLVLQGQEREQPHGSPHEPELSSLEIWPVGEPRDVAQNWQLRPGVVEPVLFTTTELLCAGWDRGLVSAEAGRVLRFDLQLSPGALLRDTFTPLALSLDEEGWVYLLVDEGEGEETRRALWVLDEALTRRLHYPLPAPLQDTLLAARVGYDHRILLQGGGQLLALEQDGAIAWSRPISPDATPAALTPAGEALLCEGQEVVAFDASGQRRVLHRCEEPLVTTPITTTSGRLLVASAQQLFCLIPLPLEEQAG